jgi:hypothetical protein
MTGSPRRGSAHRLAAKDDLIRHYIGSAFKQKSSSYQLRLEIGPVMGDAIS